MRMYENQRRSQEEIALKDRLIGERLVNIEELRQLLKEQRNTINSYMVEGAAAKDQVKAGEARKLEEDKIALEEDLMLKEWDLQHQRDDSARLREGLARGDRVIATTKDIIREKNTQNTILDAELSRERAKSASVPLVTTSSNTKRSGDAIQISLGARSKRSRVPMPLRYPLSTLDNNAHLVDDSDPEEVQETMYDH
ncbi:hypothetical protein QFC22_001883 [Naganishia vaughanmartiniae]|uniref:Uncharacterized protein n=1 Tax=Naganishia vaughanmartiniae TaxID=1424756 RepID=A0ACC2XGR9_9TREE|nr:hypothetical protein QFC22_001883 [Naganishia vaughanmartiniae]